MTKSVVLRQCYPKVQTFDAHSRRIKKGNVPAPKSIAELGLRQLATEKIDRRPTKVSELKDPSMNVLDFGDEKHLVSRSIDSG